MPTRRSPIVRVVAVVAVGITVGVVFGTESPGEAARPVTSSTTTSTITSATKPDTTTIPRAAVDPLQTDVATALADQIEVFAQPPPDAVASLLPAATTDGVARRATFATASPERAGAPDLPAIGDPIQGRHRTELGWSFGNPTPWDNPLRFVVVEDHGDWLRVQMPVRPNGIEGWIRSSEVTRSSHRFRIEIEIGARRLRAYDDATLLADTPVVVGKDSTRTPTGRFYVTDFEEKSPGSSYGQWVMPLNAYSQDLDQFAGGVPVIALHGTNRPDLLGSAASNGCIRMPNDVDNLLHDRIPLGTPVDIAP